MFVREGHLRRTQKKCSEDVEGCKELTDANSAKIEEMNQQLTSQRSDIQRLEQSVHDSSVNHKGLKSKLKHFAATFSENSFAQHKLLKAIEQWTKEMIAEQNQRVESLEAEQKQRIRSLEEEQKQRLYSLESDVAQMAKRKLCFVSFAFPGELSADCQGLKFAGEDRRYLKVASSASAEQILKVNSTGTKLEICVTGFYRICISLLASEGTSLYPFLHVGGGGLYYYFYTSGNGYSSAHLDRTLRLEQGQIVAIGFQGRPILYPSGNHYIEIHLLQ